MSWTLPVTVALVCLASILMFLAKAFDKEQRWIKTLLIMFSLGTCILISQIMRIIVDASVTGDTLTKLQSMTNVSLTISKNNNTHPLFTRRPRLNPAGRGVCS